MAVSHCIVFDASHIDFSCNCYIFAIKKMVAPKKKPGDFSHFRVQALACEFRTVFLLVTRALNQGFEFLTQSVNESRQFLFDANAFIWINPINSHSMNISDYGKFAELRF